MYYVGKVEESKFAVPHGYEEHSQGYQRLTLVDHSVGSVHMGVGICQLQPKGNIESRIHANEKGIYILEGEVEMKRGCEAFRLSADDFAVIPYGISHSIRNPEDKAARWFEMQAPQPKPFGGWQDTFFVGDNDWPVEVNPPDLEDTRTRYLGHFKKQNPTVRERVDVRGTMLYRGLTVYRIMGGELGEEFGVQHFYMHRGELSAGGARNYHDHPLEECYLVLSGEVDIELEGDRYHLRQGDVAWTGVGTSHAFFQNGDAPFRWIETQAPQYPLRNAVRNYIAWDKFRTGQK